MLTHKDIEKIRKMYYEQHYTVTEITRILKMSRNTCYKYLKFVNFNVYNKENKRAHYLVQYKEVLLSLEDMRREQWNKGKIYEKKSTCTTTFV